MARRGKDLFDRAVLTPVTGAVNAADILSGKIKWDGNRWVSASKTAKKASLKPRAEAKKPTAVAGDKVSREVAKKVADEYEPRETVTAFGDNLKMGDEDVKKVRSAIVDRLTRDLPSDSDKWGKGGSRQVTDRKSTQPSSAQILAYQHLRERGLLKGGEKDIVKQAQDFRNRVGANSEKVEYQVFIDRDGNRITAVRGDATAVGITPPHSRGRIVKEFKDGDMRSVTAGAQMHHNHPRQNEAGGLGLTFSAGDMSNTMRQARGGMSAVGKEGIYIARNTKWQEHAKANYDTIRLNSRMLHAEVNAALGAIGKEAARQAVTSGDFYRYSAPRMQAAVREIGRKYGIEVEFVPNQGYEWINEQADALLAGKII